MAKFYFETTLEFIFIHTPWFAVTISNGSKDFRRHGFWWGIEINWKPKLSHTFGEYYFSKVWYSESDFVGYYELTKRFIRA